MTHMIRTSFFHLDFDKLDVDFEVAHLYEHVLIQTYINKIKSAGMSRALYGWESGRAFRRIVFFRGNFYDPRAKELFDAFLSSKRTVDQSLLDTELLRIQAEDQSVLGTIDTTELRRQFQVLDDTPCINHEHALSASYDANHEKLPKSHVLPLQPAKHRFRDIATIVGVGDATTTKKIIFLRLAPLIYDAIDAAHSAVGAYERDVSGPFDKEGFDAELCIAIHTFRRGGPTVHQLKLNIETAIKRMREDIAVHPNDLQRYIECFISNPTYIDEPENYYGRAGLIVSRNAIAEAFTPDNVLSVIDSLQLKVTAATKEIWDQI